MDNISRRLQDMNSTLNKQTLYNSVLRPLAFALAAFWAGLLNGAQSYTVHSRVNLPLAFECQREPSREHYVARGQGYTIAIDGATMTIGILPRRNRAGSFVSMSFAGGRHVQPVAGQELPGKVNLIRGNDPRQWKLGIPTYGQVKYRDVYPGVDVLFYGNQQQVEFDLLLKPGADPRAIRMKFDGARKVSLDRAGQLVVETPSGEVTFPLPRIYQEAGVEEPTGVKKSIEGHYSLGRANEIGFEVAAYDRTKSLVIDPTVLYGDLLEGNNSVVIAANALDSAGNIYLAGYTGSTDFPTTAGAVQPGLNAGSLDGFISKINSSGTALIYSTYFGGSGSDTFSSIAVDSTGAAWVTGGTYSHDFPTMNPYQATFGGGNSDAVLVKLSPTGSLQFSTYLGGNSSDYGAGVAIDASNNAYVAGSTSGSFPTTAGVLLSSNYSSGRGFVTKFTQNAAIVYSTLLGGSGNSFDAVNGVAVDPSGNAYLTGYSSSTDFVGDPGGGARLTNAGMSDAFIAKLNSTGTALLYFTFLGGSGYDIANTIQLDSSSPPNAYIAGYTSSADLRPTPGVVGTSLKGLNEGFVAKLDGTGSAFSYITYLGGGKSVNIQSLAVEASTGDVYVTGFTNSADFPLVSPLESAPFSSTALYHTTSGTDWSPFDTNIPGLVNNVLTDPVSAGTLIVSTDVGIYRTTNGGATFTQQSPLSGASLSRSPANPNTIYAGGVGPIYLSTDDGLTWTLKGNSLSGNPLYPIVADALSVGTAYISLSSVVSKTTDGGATWTVPANTGLPPGGGIYGIAEGTDGTLYAVIQYYGLYASTDQASTWTAINTGLPSPLCSVSSPVGQLLSVSGSMLYLSCGGLIYKSTNRGSSWAPTASQVSNGSSYVSASPSNPNVVYAASPFSPVLYRSQDGGASWSAAATGLGSASISQIVFNSSGGTDAFAVASVNHDAAFVAKLNSTATALVYSTYLGGNSSDGNGIATNGFGEVFVVGTTDASFPISSTLPTAPLEPSGSFLVAISDSTAACSYSVNPGTQAISSDLQTVTFGVTAPSGCSWTASSNQPWAAVVGGTSGTGVGIVTVQAAANGAASPRSASLTINTATATLNQAAAPCIYSLDSYAVFFGHSGGSGQVNVIAPAGCPWTVTNHDPVGIIVNSGSSGSGSGTVMFTAQSDPSPNSRTLSLIIAGRGFLITERGLPGSIGVFRNGQWWLDGNGDFAWTGSPDRLFYFGQAGDVPIMGDWDNTGVIRPGVFRNGQWWLDINNDGLWDAAHDIVFNFGQAGDVPLIGDWDGTGIQRIGVFRSGQWWLDLNNDHLWDVAHDTVFQFGQEGDVPVVGDWDNTGQQRIGVFRSGQWWLDMNADHLWDVSHDILFYYGQAGDIPVIGDWTHSGQTRIGVFRQAQWWLDMNGDHLWDVAHDLVTYFGIATDRPLIGP
jgi:hypothetical protein